MSGGGKGGGEQTTGYRYSFGIHMGIARGPVDELVQIKVGDKTAWMGSVIANQDVSIDQYNLFGGEGKEGGIQGTMQVMMGESTQTASSGLLSMLGSPLPGFRRMATVFFDGIVAMNNPYPKPWKFRVRRSTKGWIGAPWNPDKSKIVYRGDAVLTAQAGETLPTFGVDARSNSGATSANGVVKSDLDPAATYMVELVGASGWSNYASDAESPGTAWHSAFRVTTTTGELAANYYGHPNAAAAMAAFVAATSDPNPPFTFTGTTQATFWIPDSFPSDNRGILYFRVSKMAVVAGSNDISSANAAHIIYECLTNPEWGRGLSPSMIDETSFIACADAQVAEGFGLCLKWSRRDSIQSFVQSVLDHMGATLFTSRTTGLITLRLIRGDYTVSALPLFDVETGLLEITESAVSAPGTGINQVEVTYHDPLTDEDKVVKVDNVAAIQAAGGVINSVKKEYPGIPIPSLARRLAQRDLRAGSMSLRRFNLVMDRRGRSIEPGSVIRIKDVKRGIPETVVRVGRIDDGTLTDGKITITGIQDVFALPTSSFVQDVPNTWAPPSTVACLDAHRAIELPYFLILKNTATADFNVIDSSAGYIGTMVAQGQAMNVGHKIAVRDSAPTSEDYPSGTASYCGFVPDWTP